LLKNYRNSSGSNYDCIVPVSGARDSYFIVHTIKNVLGMNPLLVNYNKHYNTSVGVRNLANLRIKFDCDIIIQTINPDTVKKITRGTLRLLGSIYWHCLAGQTVFPVQLAVKMKIPLIIWGAHQGLDQVGMYSHLDEVEMTRKYRKEHDLMGYEAEDLINDFDGITEGDITPYRYPENNEIEQVGVRGIYLNNYIRWDSTAQHEQMMKIYSYETHFQNRTFDNYNDVDCWNYSDTHDYIKYIKHGFGKVVDHASREIRLGRLSRNKALSLIRYYESQPLIHLDKFLNWIGITENAFYYLVDQHRNTIFWDRNNDWNWVYNELILKKRGIDNYNFLNFLRKPSLSYRITNQKKSLDSNDSYILIGKGL
jgi:N-acetyl sugar amidotransferase